MPHHQDCEPYDPATPEIDAAVARFEARGPAPEGLYWVPWIGAEYGAFEGIRLLIVGESHYEWCGYCWRNGIPRPRSLTCRVVAERLSRPEGIQHWANIELVLRGRHPDRRQVWRAVAYCNYVQKLVGLADGNGRPPGATQAMRDNARNTFLPLLRLLEPHLTLVLGTQLWESLPDERTRELTIDGRTIPWCVYESRYPACRINHPARGLGEPSHSAIIELVRRARLGTLDIPARE